MYGPPPAAVVPVAPRRGGISGPLAAMLCLGVILFLIAATIVLALIPVYLPSRNAQQTGTTKTYYFVLSPTNQTLGDDGILSNSASITSLEQMISSALGFNVNSFVIDGNVVIATVSSGKRRRRGFGLERSERGTQQNLYCHGRFLHKFCGSCLIVQTIITFSVELFYGGVLLFLEFVCKIFTIVIPVPATVGSSTATAAVTAAATTTTGTSGISG